MGSTFSGYSIATSGMNVNQNALNTVSNNISNIHTPGFSRKVLNSSEKVVVQTGRVSVENGVSVAEVRRARDVLLDQTYRRHNGALGYWETKDTNLEEIQKTLNEFVVKDDDEVISDNGLQQTVLEFFNIWSELSKDPGSQASRQSVIENAQVLLTAMQDIDEQLYQMQLDAVDQVKTSVADLNDLARQIAALNQKITQAELGGVEAGDLRDERDTILDQMSGLTNLNVIEHDNGILEVNIGGIWLVNGGNTRQLKAFGDGSTEHPLQVQWADLGIDARITSGSIKADMEDADQTGVEDITTLPYDFSASSISSMSNLRQGLNGLLTTIATAVNDLHSSGVDQDGNPGLDFFVVADASRPLSLSNIQVNSALAADPDLIVSSLTGAAGDNVIAEQIFNWQNEKNFSFNGLSTNMNGFYESLVSWVSTAGENADGYYSTKYALVRQVDNERQSISSVSLDEEMSKMIMYQNAYSASARVLSTIDSLLEGLIYDLGSR